MCRTSSTSTSAPAPHTPAAACARRMQRWRRWRTCCLRWRPSEHSDLSSPHGAACRPLSAQCDGCGACMQKRTPNQLDADHHWAGGLLALAVCGTPCLAHQLWSWQIRAHMAPSPCTGTAVLCCAVLPTTVHSSLIRDPARLRRVMWRVNWQLATAAEGHAFDCMCINPQPGHCVPQLWLQ